MRADPVALINSFQFSKPIAVIAGALKSESRSQPLDPLYLQPEQDGYYAIEAGIFYLLESKQVLNPGLFLDQELNRKFLFDLIIKQKIHQSKFLNLFSYTGSFTMTALAAGVYSATSVDLSRRYLDWDKKNYIKNFSMCTEKNKHRLIQEDARIFVSREVKRVNQYDYIVIDPPTFSRSEKGLWKVQDHLFKLLEDALKCFSGKGAILVSINDSRVDDKSFHSMIKSLLAGYPYNYRPGQTAFGFLPSHPLKSGWILGL
jgi:23S rRNA (cytosine1962-C5)-methyltransferase